MSSEPLPGEFLKDTTSFSSEPVEIGNNRWRHSPATPSSCRWSGDGGCGPFDFRRPVTAYGIHRDQKGESGRETSGLISSNMHLQSDFVNYWDHRAKDNDDGVGATNGRLEKDVSLGSSLDWKPIKWIRSGSLSSRGSGFSHLSSCKVVGVDSSDTKMDAQQGNVTITFLRSPSGDAATCVTPKTPDEANSRKKPRLGWGEGLAKYEKKKVDPVDPDDKENVSSNGTADGVSSSESLLPSPSSLPCKSPSLTGNLESTSPTTPCSFACSLSPGLEEKTSITPTIVVNNTSSPTSVAQNQTQRSPFSLENLDLTEGFNVSLLLDELLQSDDTSPHGSGFAMDKLQVWKADISRTLVITESEIDSLEHELKSDVISSPFTPASSSVLKQCNNKNADVSTDGNCTVSVGGDVYNRREDKSYVSILGANKVTSSRTSDELSKLLPTTHLRTSVSRATDDSEIKKKVEMRKRFLKFKERVTVLKFRAFQYSWKENLRLLSIRSSAKSQKKSESSSRMGYSDYQKHRASNHSRLSSSGGSLSLVPTKEVVEYANMLLSDSRVKTYPNEVKMPTFILDKKERTSSRFISDNGLVENPVDVEKERSIVNLWTIEDTETFLDKYTLFGKNFRKIASFFEHKTVADCVEFYYKYHKSDIFQKIKKKSQFAKGKSSNSNTSTTYLVTSGKRLNRETGATSLDMLGAASAMVANVDDTIVEQESHDFSIFCNEQETAAADVLAGICVSISSEALGSCVTSSVDHQKVGGSSNRRSLIDVGEETCSDDSCGEEINSSIWTDEERSSFVKAFRLYGKDFLMISRCMRTRSSDQCKLFFSKARKCLGLDAIDFGTGSEGSTGANERGGGGGSDQDDTCMVDSGSGISQEHAESDMNVVNGRSTESEFVLENPVARDCEAKHKLGEKGSSGNLEGAADSEAADMAETESPQNTCSDSASGAKVEESDTVARVSSPGNSLDLNTATENFICQETTNNGFMTSNLFPQEPARKTRDDVSSRLTFRKSSQRSSSIDGYGYQLHLHKRSQSRNDPKSLDESLLLPTDGCLQMGTDLTSDDQQQRRSSSSDIEKPNTSGGDLKLFGKIITNHSLPKSNGSVPNESETKLDAVTSSNLKTSYGFWDGNRIQTGFSALPDSAMLLAKYPAAFSNMSSLETGNEQCNNLNVLPGYPTRKLTNNRSPSYHAYGQNVVGVSDPVAVIRMHYAKTEQYKTGGGESWRSNVSDIGSR